MMAELRCRFCNRLLSEKTAYGCPSCGSYICAKCWGPDGDICIMCRETGEDGNGYEVEEEDEDDC